MLAVKGVFEEQQVFIYSRRLSTSAVSSSPTNNPRSNGSETVNFRTYMTPDSRLGWYLTVYPVFIGAPPLMQPAKAQDRPQNFSIFPAWLCHPCRAMLLYTLTLQILLPNVLSEAEDIRWCTTHLTGNASNR